MDLARYLSDGLDELYSGHELKHIIRILLEDLFDNRRHQEWSDDLEKQLSEVVQKIKSGIPIQYVTRKAFFFDLVFEVNEHVLIPRPETEELVEWILEDHDQNTSLNVLDIGVGSGCIAITLAHKRPLWKIAAIDISPEAIQVAMKNALKVGVNIDFTVVDFLKVQINFNQFDIIVSNPPYISMSEQPKMDEHVLKYEPLHALVPEGDDPLIFYRTIAEEMASQKYEGLVYLELNEFLYEEVSDLFPEPRVELRNDLQGKVRMIKVMAKSFKKN